MTTDITAICAFCGAVIALDQPAEGSPDWETVGPNGEDTGDFGCPCNPLNSDEGTGGHVTKATLIAIYKAANDLLEKADINSGRDINSLVMRLVAFTELNDAFAPVP